MRQKTKERKEEILQALLKMNKSELAEGVLKAYFNAFDLFNDAYILMEKQRKERAYTLFQLSLEECGKTLLILNGYLWKAIYDRSYPNMGLEELEKQYKWIANKFEDHQSKTSFMIRQHVMAEKSFINQQGISEKAGISKYNKEKEKEIHELKTFDRLKNMSLYTSIEDDSFVSPKEKITGEDLKKLNLYLEQMIIETKQFIEKNTDSLDYPEWTSMEELKNSRIYRY